MRYKFTETEAKKILKNLVVLVDTREQKNQHILAWFDAKAVKYKKVKNDFGDYSCMLPKGSIKGLDRDIYFDDEISIERKANIDELAGNLKSDNKNRLKSEFAHINKYGIRCHLFVEDLLFEKNIREENYRSQWKGDSLNASIEGVLATYNISFQAVDKKYMGSKIYNKLYYHVRNKLLRGFKITVDNEE